MAARSRIVVAVWPQQSRVVVTWRPQPGGALKGVADGGATPNGAGAAHRQRACQACGTSKSTRKKKCKKCSVSGAQMPWHALLLRREREREEDGGDDNVEGMVGSNMGGTCSCTPQF